MAGAFVGVADDASATFLNPAGLALLPKTEVTAGLLRRGAGDGPLGDALDRQTGIGVIGGAGALSKSWAIGGYLRESFERRALLNAAEPSGAGDSGYLEATIREGGLAASWRPTERLYFGGRVTFTHLRLQAKLDHQDSGADDLVVGMAAGNTHVSGDGGILFLVSSTVSVGAVYRQGATWTAERTAVNPSIGATLDTTPYSLRFPSSFSGGLSVRVTPRLLLAGQLDYVLYREVGSNLSIRSGAGQQRQYEIEDGVEPRLGIEFAWPHRSFSLQFRGGVMSVPPAALKYAGPDPIEGATFFGGSRETVGTIGASIASAHGVYVDVATTFARERVTVTASARFRF
jgi:long-subunit fatty acid transport protein